MTILLYALAALCGWWAFTLLAAAWLAANADRRLCSLAGRTDAGGPKPGTTAASARHPRRRSIHTTARAGRNRDSAPLLRFQLVNGLLA